ncbi:c-type cytochrome biogenesis protein CcsB [Aestuariimicrobium ganziense]|uniref:c-type cytochrome biogenesis protein CcsB n=1 Tax=Aestuariimicrobium ganziense TaxID=2773677 RepID=UPI0019456B0A|nr:c-type cytochrome biogenesis protein CcsB [Aestuariimicrobium ganziense]
MTLAELSSLGIVTSAVLYLVAFIAHSGEWAFLRGIGTDEDDLDTRVTSDHTAQRVRSDTWGRLGIGITVIAAAAHLLGVVTRGLAAGRAPWGNMYEFVTAALAFAVVAYLIGVWLFGARWLGIGMTLLLALGNGLAATVFYVAVAPLVPALHSVWFIIHIVAACIAAAAFNIAGIASILHLAKQRAANKAGGEAGLVGFLSRTPSLRAIDTLAYRSVAFGFPVWTFTIAAGSVWAEYAWGRYWGWDPKETWSLVTWVVYAAYLHARATAGWKGRAAAIIAVIGLITFWFNFIGVNLLINGLHSYAGI